MASFWAIEVKPGSRVVHICERATGKLRITQATLGIGNGTEKSLVQCDVRELGKSPVIAFICALLPNTSETCPLNLKFEETAKIIFSVIGQRSVHLTGYYLCHDQAFPYLHSDTDTYSIDIENTETEESSDPHSEDSIFGGSFIDDSELLVSAPSPKSPIRDDSELPKSKDLNLDRIQEQSCAGIKTFPDGFVIQELEKGHPIGKLAALGSKVKIHFTGMLKETGCIFESTVDRHPCHFRLGDEEVIDGLNMGIDGMSVGDKRRLIIPPSMGFGEQENIEKVPPNSWLVYDVELVGVRRY
ncbi:hypothetical protein BUALT_Bualt17G0001400 [Buddleja alternifolia]|uniref:peptidylprolyl isomerase n=1 Tax=Buddleja alternifolia TaxID=168488 RepID=A0AAV6W5Q9_9LAMI|nr:hypothetical protein BUALT_Bualt17G0001400 [Buddleja alternifolia]